MGLQEGIEIMGLVTIDISHRFAGRYRNKESGEIDTK